ncbi:MAG TPA: cytochrome d ubiquinol oxidase subunit II [Steroidobacteraceae bacterium]|nr:cytochrome d ubiquinol oxidase subunit II [Steroidobacteraceae bacterium]
MSALLDYATLRVIWWFILGLLLMGFAITDGFDLGLGASFTFLGRTDAERRALLATVEPVWEGNQVWFILGGGAAFAAWPLLYAASFSGLYLAMLLVLVALILRPVGFTYRGKLTDPRWRTGWDIALTLGGALPALLLGVAFANLFLGIPFHFDSLQRTVVSGSFFSLLHPFALLGGIISLSMLILHGNAYAALKVGEPMAARARLAGRAAAVVFLLTFLGAGFWVYSALGGYQVTSVMDHAGPSDPTRKTVAIVTGAWLNNFRIWPLMWAAPGCAVVGALVAYLSLRAQHAGAAFMASIVVQAGTILTGGFALFPFLLPSSTHPSQSLTVWDASSSAKTLLLMLAAVAVFLPIILAYTSWVFKVLRGRVTLENLHDHEGGY